MTKESPHLPYLSNENRLSTYRHIIEGCQHLWSKNQLQEDKAIPLVEELVTLARTDPYFMAHFNSWTIDKDSKDLKVLTTYANSLSAADGMPFSAGSEYMKPNLRYVSAAAIQELDPKLVLRVCEFSGIKYAVSGHYREATHFPTSLTTAIKKYLKYRENNLHIVRGIKEAGMANIYANIYRWVHETPSEEVAAILRWQQRDKDIEFEESPFDFEGLSDLEIAEKIREEELPVLGAVGALEKISPVIAVALLEQCTGNQAVIFRSLFEEQGVLEDEKVFDLYKEKIKEAKSSIDRAETVSKDASEKVKEALKETRSETRKEEMKDLGKVYLHLDFSGSMDSVMEFAIDRGTIFAECVHNPQENFRWGIFGSRGEELPLPDKFVSDAFAQELFGRSTMGSTNAYALYPKAREFGAEIDVFVTDGNHNYGDLSANIESYHRNHEHPKPKACVIVRFENDYSDEIIQRAYEENGIPVAVMDPQTLVASGLVVSSVKEAVKGPMVVIEEIMDTPLLELPDWYYTI